MSKTAPQAQVPTLDSIMFPHAVKNSSAKDVTLAFFADIRKSQRQEEKQNFLDGLLKVALFICDNKESFSSNDFISLAATYGVPVELTHKTCIEWAQHLHENKIVSTRHLYSWPLWIFKQYDKEAHKQ